MLRRPDGRPVVFVAHPDLAPSADAEDAEPVRPDDVSDDGRTWRTRLVAYNRAPDGGSLFPAYRLYANDIYRELVNRFGIEKVFILSAGWGLIPSNYFIPCYDITFAASADPWKRRSKLDSYEDFQFLEDDGDDIVFLGGKDYQPLFLRTDLVAQGSQESFLQLLARSNVATGVRPHQISDDHAHQLAI